MFEINKKLRDIIVHFTHKTDYLNQIRLVKLVYAAEIYYIEKFGERLTDCVFLNYHYGPMSDNIVTTAELISEEDIEIEFDTTPSGHEATIYRPIGREFKTDLSGNESNILEKVVRDWGFSKTKELVAFTKSTTPFLESEYGKAIDLDGYANEIALSKNKELVSDLEKSIDEANQGRGHHFKSKDELSDYFNSL